MERDDGPAPDGRGEVLDELEDHLRDEVEQLTRSGRFVLVGGTVLAAAMVMPLWPRLAAGGLTSLLATHMGLVMLGYVATLLVGFLAACYFVVRLFAGLSEGQARTLKRAALGLSGLAVTLTGVGIAFGSIF